MVAAAYCVKKPYIFHYERILPNLRCCNFFKVDIIIFRNPLKNAHFYILTLPVGVTLTNKSPKNHFWRLCKENGHNSINIKVSALKLLAFDRETNFG